MAKKMTEIKTSSVDRKGRQTTYNPDFSTIAKNLPKEEQYHSSGLPPTMISEESGETIPTESVDEGQFSEIKYDVPEKPFVIAKSDSDKYYKGEKFWLNY